jgi:hypothetical protein
MRRSGYANPRQLRVLTSMLDDHCRAHSIPAGEEREETGRLLMLLFSQGWRRIDELRAVLARSRNGMLPS